MNRDTLHNSAVFDLEVEPVALMLPNVGKRFMSADGVYRIRFGGDPKGADNYLTIAPGWNYVLRLYRPRKAILDGTWKAPELQPVK